VGEGGEKKRERERERERERKSERERDLVSLLIRILILSNQGSTSFNSNYFFKGPFSKSSQVGFM
jgi:type IV secretory pathway protease TraF